MLGRRGGKRASRRRHARGRDFVGSATTTKSVSEASAPELERAEKFYQLGNYYSASIEFNKAIEGEGRSTRARRCGPSS